MRIVLLGCPGAGKGTQAKILAERYAIAHVSSGDLLRAEISAKSQLGLRVADYLKNGILVPDATVVELVAAKLNECASGFILDGFPRTLEQARSLDQYLERGGHKIDLVLYLNLPKEEVLRRLSSRRSCSGCGALYNSMSRPPRTENVCDQCGGALVLRDDDREATVQKRLMVYEDLTQPLIAYYRTEHAFHEIDGAQSVERVTQQLASAIDSTAVRS